jgi:predicted nucleic acid-binding protein
MKHLKLYLETSTWNFYYADDAPEKQAVTRAFFESLPNSPYDLYISEVVMEEIDHASEMKATQLRNLILQVKPTILLLEPTVGQLADAYLTNQVLPPKAFADAQQIAVATVNELDYIVSWNLRHIANVHRQTKVNAINWLNGYTKPLQMITPIEVSYDNFETG